MKKIEKIARNLVMMAAVIAATPAVAFPISMQVTEQTSSPIGHVRFCQAHAGECGPVDRPNQVVRLTTSAWERLQAVNLSVNSAIIPVTDMQLFGVAEHWDYPELAGDCEDYVLEKRRSLMRSGWPESALLITVVRDEAGDGHAVLTVRTDRGDLVLDNKTDQILVWSDTPYHYLKRQSATDSSRWEAIADGRDLLVSSLGGR